MFDPTILSFFAIHLTVLTALAQEYRMTTNGMFVRESGQGTPVVLVHGFPGNARDWERVATAQYAADIANLVANH